VLERKNNFPYTIYGSIFPLFEQAAALCHVQVRHQQLQVLAAYQDTLMSEV
jgi:hypothetical protein